MGRGWVPPGGDPERCRPPQGHRAPPQGHRATPRRAAPAPHQGLQSLQWGQWGGSAQPPGGPVWGRGVLPRGGSPPKLTIVAPGHEDVLQATAGLVHPVLGAGGGAGGGEGLDPPPDTARAGRGVQPPPPKPPGGRLTCTGGLWCRGCRGRWSPHRPRISAPCSPPGRCPRPRPTAGGTGVTAAPPRVPRPGGSPRAPSPLTWGSPNSTSTLPRSCRSPTRWNQSGGERGRVTAGRGDLGGDRAGTGGPRPYLCRGAPGGSPRPSGRRGRSWGNPRRGRTRPRADPAAPAPPWRSSSAASTSRTARSGDTRHVGTPRATPRHPPCAGDGARCPSVPPKTGRGGAAGLGLGGGVAGLGHPPRCGDTGVTVRDTR